MANDIETQLRIQQEINKVLRERNQLLTEAANAACRQSEMFQQVGNSIQNNTDQLEEMSQMDFAGGLRQGFEKAREDIVESFDSIREGADDVADSLSGGFGGALSSASSALGKMGGFAKGAGIAMGGLAAGGVVVASKLTSTIGGILGFLGSTASALFGIFGALGGLVSGVFGGLIDLATGGGGGGLRQALEEVRKEFGSLANNEGAAIVKSFRRMRGLFNTVTGTGLSMRRVFGSAADRLKALHELAKAAGPSFSLLSDEFARTGVEILELSKGLRITEDAFKGVGIMAQVSGKGMQESLLGIANMSIRMGESLGMNTILITKNIATMSADFEHFGTLSQMELGRTAAVTAKLGMDVKELTGLIEKFDNFEDAAKSANMLSQAFGIQIDAMGMLKEQDPSMRLKHMQEQFKLAGRSIESMSRQEMKLLAAHTGLNAEQAALAFSSKGLSMNYDDITSAAQDAEGQTMTQAEAMGKLADSIDRMVQGGGSRPKGFFDAFGRGFLKSVRYSGPFVKLMRSINRGLRKTLLVGMQVGRAFTKLPIFDRVMDFFNSFFSPDVVDGYLATIKGTLTTFFKELTTNPAEAFKTLGKGIAKFGKDMRENIFNSFNTLVEGSEEGALTFGETLQISLYSALETGVNLIADGVEAMTKMIRSVFLGESDDATTAEQSGQNVQVTQALNSMKETFRTKFPLILGSVGDLFRDLWAEYGPGITAGVENMVNMVRPALTRVAGQIATIIYDGIVGGLAGTAVGKMILPDSALEEVEQRAKQAALGVRQADAEGTLERMRTAAEQLQQLQGSTDASPEDVRSAIQGYKDLNASLIRQQGEMGDSAVRKATGVGVVMGSGNAAANQINQNLGLSTSDITEIQEQGRTAGEALAAAMQEGTNDVNDSSSPSMAYKEIGGDIVAGLALGISEGMSDPSVVAAFEQLSTTAQPFFDSISTFVEGIVAIPAELIGSASTNMTAVVTELGNFRDVLARPGALPSLGTTMKNIGQAMAVSAQNIQIHNTPINVNAEFNVTVDSKRLANGLARTGVIVAKNAPNGQMRISHGNSGTRGARDVTLKNT